jgi:aryl-alcohol dehydrogenase-like predicted oxidoreductase
MKTRKLGTREVSAIGIGCMNVSWIWSNGAALDPKFEGLKRRSLQSTLV